MSRKGIITIAFLQHILKIGERLTSRPEISRNASAHRDVESAIILTLYPISLKYSAIVIPEHLRRMLKTKPQKKNDSHSLQKTSNIYKRKLLFNKI